MAYHNLHNKKDFEQFYLYYFPKLVRFAGEYVLSVEDAENIVQDVFLALWEHRNSFDELQNSQAYLFRLTKNKCVDYLRHKIMIEEKKQSLLDVQKKEYEYNLFSIEQLDEGILSNEKMDLLLHDAILSLPDKCKEIFILSRFGNMTHRQIADKLNISTSTVNNQISFAMRQLKEKLKNYSFLLLLFHGFG
jgi:RNA polymerase sigma-70 factor (ECF subfamily)